MLATGTLRAHHRTGPELNIVLQQAKASKTGGTGPHSQTQVAAPDPEGLRLCLASVGVTT